jgi:hypothetical protein
MTTPNGLPYVGALDAVQRIETALSERDAALAASNDALAAANAEAERLLSAARAAGTGAGEERREALLTAAHADAEKIRADGDAEARQLTQRVATERDRLADEFAALLVEEP